MAHAIVVLDLKNFSKLSERGKRAVFEEFLPRVADCLTADDVVRDVVDANTWGDSVIAIFNTTTRAANFALDVLNIVTSARWAERELNSVAVRIALHTADLELGTDRVRSLKAKGPHAYGGGIVVPARIEPIVPPNSICFTADAKPQIEQAIRDKNLRAEPVVDLGEQELVKGAGRAHLHLLRPIGGKLQEPASEIANADLVVLELLRHRIVRAINEYVERYHIYSSCSRCRTTTHCATCSSVKRR